MCDEAKCDTDTTNKLRLIEYIMCWAHLHDTLHSVSVTEALSSSDDDIDL